MPFYDISDKMCIICFKLSPLFLIPDNKSRNPLRVYICETPHGYTQIDIFLCRSLHVEINKYNAYSMQIWVVPSLVSLNYHQCVQMMTNVHDKYKPITHLRRFPINKQLNYHQCVQMMTNVHDKYKPITHLRRFPINKQ